MDAYALTRMGQQRPCCSTSGSTCSHHVHIPCADSAMCAGSPCFDERAPHSRCSTGSENLRDHSHAPSMSQQEMHPMRSMHGMIIELQNEDVG